MPANVESMFSVKLTPWHNLGKVLTESPSDILKAIVDAGLNFDVVLRSCFIKLADNSDALTAVPANAMIRTDNNRVLGVVGPNTHPLQNADAFSWFQPFLDAGEASLETAGSLDEGRKVWVLAKLNRANSEIVKGDAVAKFLMLSNAHDGSAAIRVGFTPIRVVCANTLAAAHGNRASKLLRVTHTKKAKDNLELIRETVDVANEAFEATAEQYRLLASKQINSKDLRTYVKTVFKMETDDTKLATRSKNILDGILAKHESNTSMVQELLAGLKEREAYEQALGGRLLEDILDATVAKFEAGKGTENQASRGTYWTAYNAVTEYLNHERGRTEDSRLNSLWFGDSSRVNQQAFNTALAAVN